MAVVWKFPLEWEDKVQVPMPRGTTILSADVQDGRPVVWGLVKDFEGDAPPFVTRAFRVAGTGHPIDEGVPMTFVGTIRVSNHVADLVFHIFDMGEL
jgi:hypothetical protein